MMSGSASSNGQAKALKALDRRAKAILKARPAYREMVDFYLTVFRRQIEWRGRLVVNPQEIDDDQRRECLKAGRPLIDRFDPELDSESLANLWTEMKAVFRRGNDVLRQAIEQIDQAEKTGDLTPAAWLPEQRPDRYELVADAASLIGIEESVLATLARAVTLPHWQKVAETWLPNRPIRAWKRAACPACGGPPGLVELRQEPSPGEGLTGAKRRLMHCPFCATHWTAPTVRCPACDSVKSGDAKYYYTPDEPDLRIDFCKSCNHYIKVVNTGKAPGSLHVGLELLTTSHLDAIAQEKDLTPLEIRA